MQSKDIFDIQKVILFVKEGWKKVYEIVEIHSNESIKMLDPVEINYLRF